MASHVPAEHHAFRPRLDFEIEALEPATLNLKNLLFWRSMMLAELAKKDLLITRSGDLLRLTMTLVITDSSDR